MTGEVLLVRHTEVALAWHGRCYGHSDMGLSREGTRHARKLAVAIASEPLAAIVHSGLRRTGVVADLLARMTGLAPIADPRWRERGFGDWEGRSWDAIWRATGNAMDGMMTDPEGFRPGGGETGAELATRCYKAWHALPMNGRVVVIAHGGPIGALGAAARNASLHEVPSFIPKLGGSLKLPRTAFNCQLSNADLIPRVSAERPSPSVMTARQHRRKHRQ